MQAVWWYQELWRMPLWQEQNYQQKIYLKKHHFSALTPNIQKKIQKIIGNSDLSRRANPLSNFAAGEHDDDDRLSWFQ